MLVLKLYLCSGLIVHKVIWEVLKRASDVQPVETRSLKLTAIKTIKVLMLLGIAVQIWLPEVWPIVPDPAAIRLLGTVIYSIGLGTAIIARFQLGHNWANIETGQLLRRHDVVAKGIYAYVRHPIYTGDLLLLFGLELALNSWLVLGVLLLVPIVMKQAVREEQMLIDGLAGYEAYAKRSKRFIPFIY